MLTLFTSQILTLLRFFDGGLKASGPFLPLQLATSGIFLLLLSQAQVLKLLWSYSLRRPIQVYLALFRVRKTPAIGGNQLGRLHIEIPRLTKRGILEITIVVFRVNLFSTFVFADSRVHELVE